MFLPDERRATKGVWAGVVLASSLAGVVMSVFGQPVVGAMGRGGRAFLEILDDGWRSAYAQWVINGCSSWRGSDYLEALPFLMRYQVVVLIGFFVLSISMIRAMDRTV
jgi:hypothetical protein